MAQSKKVSASGVGTKSREETGAELKKKRSYFSKLWRGRRKSKERRERKKRQACNLSRSSATTSNNTQLEGNVETKYDPKKKRKQKKPKTDALIGGPDVICHSNSAENQEKKPRKLNEKRSRSDDNTTPRPRRGFFGNLLGGKKKDFGIVSVELSSTSGKTPPDLISPDARHSSITPKSSERQMARSAAERQNNDNNNNKHSETLVNLQKIQRLLDKEKAESSEDKLTSTPKRETGSIPSANKTAPNWSKPRQLVTDFSNPANNIQYDSATVGRRSTKKKSERYMAATAKYAEVGLELPRSRSFSGKILPGNPARLKPKAENREASSATKYANQVRESSLQFGTLCNDKKIITPTKGTNKFARWHSVGDLQKQIERENPNSTDLKAFTIEVTPDDLKSRQKMKRLNRKSISLQDLTSGDLCSAARQSTYQRVPKRHQRAPSRGSALENVDTRKSVAPNFATNFAAKSCHVTRPSLEKALSKSDANISTMQYRRRIESDRPGPGSITSPVDKTSSKNVRSPKRHSVEVLDGNTAMVYPIYRSPQYSTNIEPTVLKTNKMANYVTASSSLQAKERISNYNVTGNHTRVVPDFQTVRSNSQYDDILYNHITHVDQSSPLLQRYQNEGYNKVINCSDPAHRLPYVSDGVHSESLLRNSKSTGALLSTHDCDVQGCDVPSITKSIYEQRASVPDYSGDVEALLNKLRRSLNDKNTPGQSNCPADSVANYNVRADGVGCGFRPRPNNQSIGINSALCQSKYEAHSASSSPHRAAPSEQRGPGLSRSRSRARSIARRFNLSGSSENLTGNPLSLCTSSNWSTELDRGANNLDADGYCKMKSLVPPLPPKKHYGAEVNAVSMRYCPTPVESGIMPFSKSGAYFNSHPIEMRHLVNHNSERSAPLPNANPNQRETFYYGRRPVSGSYAEHPTFVPGTHYYDMRNVKTVDSKEFRERPSNSFGTPGRTEVAKRPKIFYALDV